MSGSLPVLKIVPLESIIIHEHHDKRRSEKLAIKIKDDGVLKDPPIVAKLEGEAKYVHLDGANRIDTLRLLGCRDILVQIVDYYDEESVRLDSWCHLTQMDKGLFLSQLRGIEGLEIERIDCGIAEELLGKKKVLCCIFFSDKEVYAIKRKLSPKDMKESISGESAELCETKPLSESYERKHKLGRMQNSVSKRREVSFEQTERVFVKGRKGLKSRVLLLNKVVDIYKDNITRDIVEQSKLADQIDSLFRKHSHEGCNVLVVFPKFTPKEVVELAASNVKIPAGITRHIITNRALRVNFPLMILSSKAISLEEKNILLEDYLMGKSPRVYKESTVMYDE